MKQILFFALFGLAACDVYLPPRRYSSTTNVASRRPSTQYGAPASQYGTPTSQYGTPTQQRQQQQVPILRLDTNNNGDGTYSYAYETANGISGQEQGDARQGGTRAQGGFAYTSPEGQPIQVQYTADENGFIPQGSHLPVALTGPILKSIQQNLADERRGLVDNGQYRPSQSQGYAQKQTYATNQQVNIPQKYGAPTRYTPQKYNTVQQYNRAPQATQNAYIPPSYNRRPQQGGYKF